MNAAAGWMSAALLAAGPIALGTWAFARAAASRGRSQRHVWLHGMVVASLWPLLGDALADVSKRVGGNAATVVLDALPVARLAPVFVPGDARVIDWAAIVAAAWLLSTALVLARLASGALALHRRRRSWASAEVDGVAVRLSDDVGPAVVGFRRMDIVLPRWTLDLDASLRALVLRHEEEHRRAGDPRLLLAAEVLLALAPWNPALWWMARHLRAAMELDCDARVLGDQRAPSAVERYGLLLLLISQRRATAPRLAPALIERPSSLERRIVAMRTTTPGSLRRTLALLVLGAGSLVTACSLVSPNVESSNVERPDAPAQARTQEDRLRDMAEQGSTFFEFQVTKQVAPVPGNRGPIYPAELRAAGMDGEVLAQFVVDTLGYAEMTSFKVIDSSHEQFASSVRDVLPTMRFVPAEVHGRKVRQLVQMPFVFGISK